MKRVTSRIKINGPALKNLSRSSIIALEKTGTALKTEVVKSQVMPFGEDIYDSEGKKVHSGGNMQNDNTNVNYDNSSKGQVDLISNTPYARRMYFHPEYNFKKFENANAQGKWLEPWISGKEKDFCKNTFAKNYRREAGL